MQRSIMMDKILFWVMTLITYGIIMWLDRYWRGTNIYVLGVVKTSQLVLFVCDCLICSFNFHFNIKSICKNIVAIAFSVFFGAMFTIFAYFLFKFLDIEVGLVNVDLFIVATMMACLWFLFVNSILQSQAHKFSIAKVLNLSNVLREKFYSISIFAMWVYYIYLNIETGVWAESLLPLFVFYFVVKKNTILKLDKN